MTGNEMQELSSLVERLEKVRPRKIDHFVYILVVIICTALGVVVGDMRQENRIYALKVELSLEQEKRAELLAETVRFILSLQKLDPKGKDKVMDQHDLIMKWIEEKYKK